MNTGRKTFRTADLIKQNLLVIGDGYRAKNTELSVDGLPFARAGNIDDGFKFEGCDHFPLKDIRRAGNKVSQPGDVVFTSKGTVGRFAFVQQETPQFVYSPQLCFWRSNDKDRIDPRFLFCWMRGEEFWEQADAMKGQTDMADYVSLRDQRRMLITLPDIGDQRGIARLLGGLDNKIELNQRMNRTLEDLAAGLFRSWFVDFDPVVAKAAGRKPAHLRLEITALFPAHWQDSPLGEIPKGWEIKRVCDVYSALFDGPHATPAVTDSGPVFLGIKNMTGTRIDLSDVRHIAESEYPRWTRRVTPSAGDIVFTYEATLGFCAIIPDGLRCCLGRRMALVRCDSKLTHFLFHTFASDVFQTLIESRAWHGSTVNRIPLTEFPNYPILWPGQKLAETFGNLVRNWWAAIHHNENESRMLAELRDMLLPKLLAGELRVKQAEKMVEAVA